MTTTDFPSRNDRTPSRKALPSSNHFASIKARPDSSNRAPDRNRSGPLTPVSSPYEKLIDECRNDPEFQQEEKAGTRIGFYRFIQNIGKGNFARVKLGLHLLAQEKVAIKILDRNKLDIASEERFRREISSIEVLHHPNIIRLYEVIELAKEYYIVTEFVPEGTLQKRITMAGKINESDGKYFFAQITAAVDHMHRKGIVHRDIKADNIFFANSRLIKLGDFGFSTKSDRDELLSTFCGSPPYAAPELYSNEEYSGFLVDIWAMGILLYFMVTALMPFREENLTKLKKSVINGEYSIPGFLSVECQELIRGILETDPLDRFSIERIRSSHWLNKETFPEQLEPFPRNLTNFWTRVDDDQPKFLASVPLPKSSLESAACERLEQLGITRELLERTNFRSEDKLLANEKSLDGTYRIIIHRLQKDESLLESDEDPKASSKKINRSISTQIVSEKSRKNSNVNRRSSVDLSARNKNRLGGNDPDSVQMTQTCSIL